MKGREEMERSDLPHLLEFRPFIVLVLPRLCGEFLKLLASELRDRKRPC